MMSGEVARDYVRIHLQYDRVDSMGRNIYRCSETEVTWVEERRSGGYGEDTTVLRQVTR